MVGKRAERIQIRTNPIGNIFDIYIFHFNRALTGCKWVQGEGTSVSSQSLEDFVPTIMGIISFHWKTPRVAS